MQALVHDYHLVQPTLIYPMIVRHHNAKGHQDDVVQVSRTAYQTATAV